MKPHDSAVELARRYHCLTCVLGEAMEADDAPLVEDIFKQRQAIIEWLAQEPLSGEALDWLDKTAELENRLLADWNARRAAVIGEQGQESTRKRAIGAYRKLSA
ncbi:MAG: hypothetical protein JSS66_13935 [Armatimonadetes bacterium]|nr:hypothetical protein [Armatimonadota bacterium]